VPYGPKNTVIKYFNAVRILMLLIFLLVPL